MCGIGAVAALDGNRVPELSQRLAVMNRLLEHRGPDGEGAWTRSDGSVGLAHRRLTIIDLSDAASQPMCDEHGRWITYNGEIYNYRELRREIGSEFFRTSSDTEVVLRAYAKWGPSCVQRLRGMFAFAIWDEVERTLFCARDRFGIKPFYYSKSDDVLHCASEVKAILPFVRSIDTDLEALTEYLTFQFVLGGKTLFDGVRELPAAHTMTVSLDTGSMVIERYWEVEFEPDFDHTEKWFVDELRELVDEAVCAHTVADVPVGAYLSGGLDSSAVAALAAKNLDYRVAVFTGRFEEGDDFDESHFARLVAREHALDLHVETISADDFVESIRDVVYHLDYPIAGPGAFPQYQVSRFASRHRKVLLGGQGGDEIFGGYARYLLAYFEQCIKAAIDGTMHSGNFVVTYDSIIPNLPTLRAYKPLMQEFWKDGLFANLDERYFRLLNRAPQLGDLVDWPALGNYSPRELFFSVFRARNVPSESYFDSMTHFDFKTLLPALLHVEDRVSMAHGLESRVPFVDHRIVEFAARLPADVKFRNGDLKHALRRALQTVVPRPIVERKDKMGFPVPLTEWSRGPLRDFIIDTFRSGPDRAYLRPDFDVERLIDREASFGRSLWGLLSLELWQQTFHDRTSDWRNRAAEQQSHTLEETRTIRRS